MSSHSPLLAGSIVVSIARRHYRVLELLGEGGFGQVFKARCQEDGELVAIKFPKTDQDSRQFDDEITLYRQLAHPHLAALLDWGPHFAVFELLHGRTLREHLIKEGAIAAITARAPMLHVLEALTYLHEHGVVHCDVKPHNIMIVDEGAKLFDLGSALMMAPGTAARRLFSPAYSAPEQLLGTPPSTKFDLYAWGLVWLECLAGQPVFAGPNVERLYRQQIAGGEVPLPAPLIGHPLGELLRTVLHKDPRQRAGDAQQLYRQLLDINLRDIPRGVGVDAYRYDQSTQPLPSRSDVTG